MKTAHLRTNRLNRGKSIAALAPEIGVTQRVLRAAETGTRPQPHNAVLIANYFGLDATDLWPAEEVARTAA